MKKPTKKELINLLKEVSFKLNEHQTAEKAEQNKIVHGYTLAACVDGLTELNMKITSSLVKL